MRSIFILFPILLLACAEKDAENTEQQTDLSEIDNESEFSEKEGGEDKEDYSEDKEDESSEDKEDYSEDKEDETGEDKEDIVVTDCPVDFDSDASCSGSWEETLCSFEDLIWWCQDGEWMNESEK